MSEASINQDNLPTTWALTNLGSVVNYGSTNKAEPHEITDGDWILELEDIEKDSSRLLQKMTFLQRQSKSTKNRFQAGDVLYGKLRPYLNKVLIADEPGYCTTEILPLKTGTHIDNRYLFYWLKHPVFLKYVEAESHGMNMPRLGTETGKAAPFVLAPRNEQTRIANQLDTLLTRVQACNDRFDAIPALIKRFRQTVLVTAHAGDLTEDWRVEHGHKLVEVTTLGSVLKVSSGNFLPGKDMALNGKIPVFGGNGINGYHDHGNVQEKTLVIGRVGFYCGSIHLTPNSAWVTDNALIVRHDPSQTNREYLHYALKAVDLRVNDSSTAQPVISGQKIYPLPLRVPSVAEQLEIVRRVDALFALADIIEARCTAARTQAQRLTPLVLAKAFRGELVPQDPSDESATQLLENLVEQKRLLAKQPKVLRSSNDHVMPVPMGVGVTAIRSKTHLSYSIPSGLQIGVDFGKPVELSLDQLRNLPDVYSVRRTNNAISMTKSRHDEDVKNKPYLADQLRRLGRPASAEELFKASDLPVADFYKQLAWEVAQRYVKDGKTTLETGDAT